MNGETALGMKMTHGVISRQIAGIQPEKRRDIPTAVGDDPDLDPPFVEVFCCGSKRLGLCLVIGAQEQVAGSLIHGELGKKVPDQLRIVKMRVNCRPQIFGRVGLKLIEANDSMKSRAPPAYPCGGNRQTD